MNSQEQERFNKTYQPIGGRPMTAGQLKAFKNREKYAKKEPIGKTGQQECARIFIVVRNEKNPKLANDIKCGFYSIKEAENCANLLHNIYKGKEEFIIIRVLVYHKVHKWIREAVAQRKIDQITSTIMPYEIVPEEIEIKKSEEPIESIKTARKSEANIVYNPNNSNQPLISFNKSTYALTVANGLDEDNVVIERVNIYSRLTKNMVEYFINEAI